ncbi:translation initiation factor IF-2 N-terminal domain-containing protein, partial [Streptomyces caeni]
MAKVRVYELAKEFGVESKVVMAKLQELGEFVRSASSTIEAPVVRKLTDALQQGNGGGAKPAARKASPAKPAAPSPAQGRGPSHAPKAAGERPAAPRPAAPKPPAAERPAAPAPGPRPTPGPKPAPRPAPAAPAPGAPEFTAPPSAPAAPTPRPGA